MKKVIWNTFIYLLATYPTAAYAMERVLSQELLPRSRSSNLATCAQLNDNGKKLHLEGMELFMQAQSRNSADVYRLARDKFLHACQCYLKSWDMGDPTAESMINKIMDYICSAQREIKELDVFELPVLLSQVCQKKRDLIARKEELAQTRRETKSQLTQSLPISLEQVRTPPDTNSSCLESNTTDRCHQDFLQGYEWQLQAFQALKQFEKTKEELYPLFIRSSLVSCQLYLSASTTGHPDALQKVFETLEEIAPLQWGMMTLPDSANQQLNDIMGQLQYCVDPTRRTGANPTILELKNYYEMLKQNPAMAQGNISPTKDNRFVSFSLSIPPTKLMTATAAACALPNSPRPDQHKVTRHSSRLNQHGKEKKKHKKNHTLRSP